MTKTQSLLDELTRFPWKNTLLTLRERFREDHLGLSASSLTFTTSIAMVPFFTVALALFTAFPIFAKLQVALQTWLVDSLIPDNIAKQVLGYLTQFAGKASRLGVVGFGVLFFTALALTLTIDRTLNAIWRVRHERPFGQRVLIYWATITLGPLILGASLATTSYAVSVSQGLVGGMPGGLRFVLDTVEFFLLAGGMAAMYRYVPNTSVKWGHAFAGGLFVSVGIEIAKKLLGLYIAFVPTYSMVYGAFATLPILLVWIYVGWVIVLLGAVIAAYLPVLLSGVVRRPHANGWEFQLAIEVLQKLRAARDTAAKGLTMPSLVEAIRVDGLELEPVLAVLTRLDWIGQLDSAGQSPDCRYVMLANPDTTAVAPLVSELLLPETDSVGNLWKNSRMSALRLAEVL